MQTLHTLASVCCAVALLCCLCLSLSLLLSCSFSPSVSSSLAISIVASRYDGFPVFSGFLLAFPLSCLVGLGLACCTGEGHKQTYGCSNSHSDNSRQFKPTTTAAGEVIRFGQRTGPAQEDTRRIYSSPHLLTRLINLSP